MLSTEIKMIRLRISDYYRDPLMEPIFYKIWKLMIEVQYEKTLLKAVSQLGHIPLATSVYERLIPVFETALGVYYQSSYYVAKRPVYKADTVFFDRFCYDFVSLFGVNILFLEIQHLEMITRKVYSAVSYNFDKDIETGGTLTKKGEEGLGLHLIALECVGAAFTEDQLSESKHHLSVKSRFLNKISENMKDIKTRIQIVNRKQSEDDFIEKVEQEKRENDEEEVRSLQSPDRRAAESGSEEEESGQPPKKKTIFSTMLDPEAALAEKERKKEDKRRIVQEMRIR